MALFNINHGSSSDFLTSKQYALIDQTGGTIGTYTSGTAITSGASYPHAFIVNVKGQTGTFSASRSGSGGEMCFCGIKNGVITTIYKSSSSNSHTVNFSDYDYLYYTGAAGGDTTTTYTITES